MRRIGFIFPLVLGLIGNTCEAQIQIGATTGPTGIALNTIMNIGNIAIGPQSCESLTAGYTGYTGATGAPGNIGVHNTAVGVQTGMSLTIGQYNTALGSQAGKALRKGAYNVLVGGLAGSKTDSGSYNTFLGYRSSDNNVYANYCSSLGYLATVSNPAQYATALGSNSSAVYDYSTAVGAGSACNWPNSLVLGRSGDGSTGPGGPADYIGIGVNTPGQKLHIKLQNTATIYQMGVYLSEYFNNSILGSIRA